MAVIYKAHHAVIFVIAQLSCFTVHCAFIDLITIDKACGVCS